MKNNTTDIDSPAVALEQIKNIDKMLERQEQKSSAIVYDRFKTLWNKHKIARFVTGIVLAGGAITATATGATVVAGGFIATRAILGALGGYIATDAALDMVNNRLTKNKLEKLVFRIDSGESTQELENEFRNIHKELSESLTTEDIEQEMEKAKKSHQLKKTAKKIIAGVVGIGIGLIGGTHAVEAATNSNETMSLVKSKVGNILNNTPNPSAHACIAKPSIQNIFDDIKADYPKQGYVTLEQAVRRVEGLKQGIDLDHSGLLKKLNTSVYELVRNPDGAIVQTMKDMNLLTEGQGVDSVAGRLTEGQIAEILQKTYGTEFPVNGTYISESLANIPETAPATIISPKIPMEVVPESGGFGWVKGLGVAIATGALAWFGWTKFQNKKVSPETIPASSPETIQSRETSANSAIVSESGSSSTEEQVPVRETRPTQVSEIICYPDSSQNDRGSTSEQTVSTPKTVEVPTEEVEKKLTNEEEERMNRFVAFTRVTQDNFGFKFVESESKLEDIFGKVIFKKKTLGGEFVASYEESPGREGKIELSWFDNKKKKSTITQTLISPEKTLILFEKIFMETLKKRDEIKNQEMLTLHTVEVNEQDLKSMYQQLEHPYVLENNTETGGYWFQSCYGLQDGVLRFENLVNPTMEEMTLTGGSFSTGGVEGSPGSKYIGRNKDICLSKKFDVIERKYIIKIHNIEHAASLKAGKERVSMLGAVNYYNYHKHPGYLNHPSGMDLNHENAARGRFESEIGLQVLTWAIVNELPSNINESNKPRNSHILRRSQYGGQRDYIVSFWKVHRNATNSNYRTSDCIPLDFRII